MPNNEDDQPDKQPEPSSSAEFGAELTPEGSMQFTAGVRSTRAQDLLPLVGVVALGFGSATTIAACTSAGTPWWVSIPTTLIQMCVITFVVRPRRTR